MRVAMYYSNKEVRIEELPVPRIGPGELLLRVEASGICGSDVLEWYRRDKVPCVLGHEVAGVVVAVGEGVEQHRPGDRICAAHHVPCNTCRHCLAGHHTVCETLRRTTFDPGGFAEYLRLPAINVDRGVYRLSDSLSFEEATFIEPLACVLRGQRLAGLRAGQCVLVIGSGISGLLHAQAARAQGAAPVVVVDLVDFRLETARRLGADAVLHAQRDEVPRRLREINGGWGADLVVVCTGATAAIGTALRSVERAGTVLFFAAADEGATFSAPLNDLFWRSEITLRSSYAGSPADHEAALRLIEAQRVDVEGMITHRLGLAETGLGIQLVAAAQESIKVIVEPHRDAPPAR